MMNPEPESDAGRPDGGEETNDAYESLRRRADAIRCNVAASLEAEGQAGPTTVAEQPGPTGEMNGDVRPKIDRESPGWNPDEVLRKPRIRSEMIYRVPGSFERPPQPLIPMFRLPGWVPHVLAAFAGMGLFWFFSITILQDFRGMFEEFALDLPAVTRLLLGMGALVSNHGLWLIPLATLGLAVVFFVASTFIHSLFPSTGNGRSSKQYQTDAELATSLANWSMHWREFDGQEDQPSPMADEFPLLMELAADSVPADQAKRIRGFLRHWVNGHCGPSAAGVMTDIPPSMMQCGLDAVVDHSASAMEGVALAADGLDADMARERTGEESKRDHRAQRFLQLASLYLFRRQVFRSRSVASHWGPVWVISAGLMIGFVVLALFAPLVSLVTGLS